MKFSLIYLASIGMLLTSSLHAEVVADPAHGLTFTTPAGFVAWSEGKADARVWHSFAKLSADGTPEIVMSIAGMGGTVEPGKLMDEAKVSQGAGIPIKVTQEDFRGTALNFLQGAISTDGGKTFVEAVELPLAKEAAMIRFEASTGDSASLNATLKGVLASLSDFKFSKGKGEVRSEALGQIVGGVVGVLLALFLLKKFRSKRQ